MASGNRTPLRRISQGSLSHLARSQSGASGSTGLEFLAPAMSELAEEMETMVANLEGLNELSDSLESFNEAFASFLFVMKMNTLCVEWPEAPTAVSFLNRVEALERELANRSHAQHSIGGGLLSPSQSHPPAGEISYAVPSAPEPTPSPATGTKAAAAASAAGAPAKKPTTSAPPPSRKAKKPQMTPKEKKARSIWIEKLINLAPFDFRGNNPALRKAGEEVLNGLIEAGADVRPADLVKPNILPPVMVNKCLIAFVAAKLVQKSNVNGVAMYQLSELGYKDQPE